MSAGVGAGDDSGSRLDRLRRWSAVAGAVLLGEAVLLGVLVASGRVSGWPLPVTLSVPSTAGFAGAGGAGAGGAASASQRIEVTQIDLGVALVVLCLIVGVARVLPAVPVTRRGWVRGLESGVHTMRWVEFSLVASITVFLVAALNGITDLGALVLVYASTSGMVLFVALQERVVVGAGHALLPLCFGAALGIVPWGVIAFHEVVGPLVGVGAAGGSGAGPSVGVRVVTLVMLTSAFAFFAAQWHEQRARLSSKAAPPPRPRPAVTGEWMHLLLTLVSTTLFAALAVAFLTTP